MSANTICTICTFCAAALQAGPRCPYHGTRHPCDTPDLGSVIKQRDAKLAQLRADNARLTRERDEAMAEVERVTIELEHEREIKREDVALLVRERTAAQRLADAHMRHVIDLREDVATLTRSLDEARAEVRRLANERAEWEATALGLHDGIGGGLVEHQTTIAKFAAAFRAIVLLADVERPLYISERRAILNWCRTALRTLDGDGDGKGGDGG